MCSASTDLSSQCFWYGPQNVLVDCGHHPCSDPAISLLWLLGAPPDSRTPVPSILGILHQASEWFPENPNLLRGPARSSLVSVWWGSCPSHTLPELPEITMLLPPSPPCSPRAGLCLSLGHLFCPLFPMFLPIHQQAPFLLWDSLQSSSLLSF